MGAGIDAAVVDGSSLDPVRGNRGHERPAHVSSCRHLNCQSRSYTAAAILTGPLQAPTNKNI